MNLSRFLLLSLAAGALASAASAQTVINSVPYNIASSGKYVLGANLITASATQSAIAINAPNVILDLNGFFVSGPGNNPTSGVGVIFVSNVSNVTIQNGTIANNGFGIVFALGSGGINHLVQDLVITRCLISGISFNSASSGSLVRRNVISQIGGYTASTNSNAQGIFTKGGVRMDDNVITDVAGTGTGAATGIFGAAGDFMIANTIYNSGTTGTAGISGGKYQRNIVTNFNTGVTGGTDAGGNF